MSLRFPCRCCGATGRIGIIINNNTELYLLNTWRSSWSLRFCNVLWSWWPSSYYQRSLLRFQDRHGLVQETYVPHAREARTCRRSSIGVAGARAVVRLLVHWACWWARAQHVMGADFLLFGMDGYRWCTVLILIFMNFIRCHLESFVFEFIYRNLHLCRLNIWVFYMQAFYCEISSQSVSVYLVVQGIYCVFLCF